MSLIVVNVTDFNVYSVVIATKLTIYQMVNLHVPRPSSYNCKLLQKLDFKDL